MTNSNELIPINQTLTVNDLMDGWSNFCIITFLVNTKNDLPTWDDCEMTLRDGKDGLIVDTCITDNKNMVCLYAVENKTLMVTIGDYRLLINLLDKENPELIKKYGTFSYDTFCKFNDDILRKMLNVGIYNKATILDELSSPIDCLDRIDNVKYKNIITCLKKYNSHNELEIFLSQVNFPQEYAKTVNITYDIDDKLMDCSKFIIAAITLKDHCVSLNVYDGDKNFITPNMIDGESSYKLSYITSCVLQIYDSSSINFENNHTVMMFIEKNNKFLLKNLDLYDVAKSDEPDLLDAKKLERCLAFMIPTKTVTMMNLLKYVAYPTAMLSQYVIDKQFKKILDENSKPVSIN